MHPKSLSKGTALITGGAKRIGKSIALYLASQGYRIALHYNTSLRDAQRTADEIIKNNGRCDIFLCDLSDELKTRQLIPTVIKTCSQLNLLINSASIFEVSSIKSGDIDSFNSHFAVNLRAPYILTSSFTRHCKKGQIINILDTNIAKNKTSHAAYLLSKKSLADLTKLAAVELAPGIRVNGIAPGLILPPSGKKTDYLNRLAASIPLKRKGDPRYLNLAVQFFLDNTYVTGQILFEDGGEHLVG